MRREALGVLRPAITENHRPGDLNNRNFMFSQFWKLKVQDSSASRGGFREDSFFG
jgi:hypothetical protein